MGCLQCPENLSIDVEEKIIDMEGIGLTQTKVAAYYKVPINTL